MTKPHDVLVVTMDTKVPFKWKMPNKVDRVGDPRLADMQMSMNTS